LINQLKIISKETLIYGVGNAAGSIISFLLLPLYTKFLTPADYGYLAIFAVFQSVIEITAAFGLSSGLFRYYLMAENKTEQRKVISTCFWTQLIFIVVISAIFFPLSKQFSFIFFENTNFSKYFIFVTATGLLSAFGGFVFSYMRAERKPIFFAIIQIVKIILLAITNIYFVVILHKSYQGVIIGNFGVTFIISLFVLLWFARFLKFSFSYNFFKRLLIFITPIYVVNVFFFILSLSDRLFLNHFLSTKEVGLYSFGSKIGSIVMLGIITPFSTAIVPYALSIAKEDHFKNTFSKILKYFLLVLTFFSLCIFYFSKEIVLVVSNKSYMNASGIIGPILLSGIFYGLYYNLSIAIDIVEKTYLASIVVIVGALVSIAINYFTIPLFGMYGSALASSVSNGVLFLLMYHFCQKHYPIQYEVVSFFKLLGVALFYVVMYFAIQTLTFVALAIIIKFVLCMLFPFILYELHIFDSKERTYCLSFIQKITLKIHN
jgi:O-antigen/teichoic acid export membrane protein